MLPRPYHFNFLLQDCKDILASRCLRMCFAQNLPRPSIHVLHRRKSFFDVVSRFIVIERLEFIQQAEGHCVLGLERVCNFMIRSIYA